MAKYQLKIKKSAEKELANLPHETIVLIKNLVLKLSDNPFPPGYKKLKGFKDFYRIRSGSYRIIYSVQHNELFIEVLKIAHRKDAY
ncbi:MAG: type II toxin-antitoxin system RelE/ParE family toxin [Ginsengibacter sp.]|jgi:mRNA interferase RelE/StbE